MKAAQVMNLGPIGVRLLCQIVSHNRTCHVQAREVWLKRFDEKVQVRCAQLFEGCHRITRIERLTDGNPTKISDKSHQMFSNSLTQLLVLSGLNKDFFSCSDLKRG